LNYQTRELMSPDLQQLESAFYSLAFILALREAISCRVIPKTLGKKSAPAVADAGLVGSGNS